MIPVTTFNLLIAVEALLFLYALIDVKNKYYGNIMAAFIASLIGVFLSVVISVGVVQYDPACPVSYGYNATVGDSTIFTATCANCPPVVITDLATGFILMLFAIPMMIYSFLMIYDAYIEYKEERERPEREMLP